MTNFCSRLLGEVIRIRRRPTSLSVTSPRRRRWASLTEVWQATTFWHVVVSTLSVSRGNGTPKSIFFSHFPAVGTRLASYYKCILETGDLHGVGWGEVPWALVAPVKAFRVAKSYYDIRVGSGGCKQRNQFQQFNSLWTVLLRCLLSCFLRLIFNTF